MSQMYVVLGELRHTLKVPQIAAWTYCNWQLYVLNIMFVWEQWLKNNLNVEVGDFGENVPSERAHPIYIKSTNIIDKMKLVREKLSKNSLTFLIANIQPFVNQWT